MTSAGSTRRSYLPFTIKDRKALPKGLQASVRWYPIPLAIAPVDPASEVSRPGIHPLGRGHRPHRPAASRRIRRQADPDQRANRRHRHRPRGAGGGPDRGDKAFIDAPAQATDPRRPRDAPGDVVAPAAVKVAKTSFTLPVTMPSVPGRYRLTVTLHDGDGVEYDDTTQAMIPTLNVRVTGDYDAAIDVVAIGAADHPSGSAALGIRVTQHRQARRATVRSTRRPVETCRRKAGHRRRRWLPLSAGAVLARTRRPRRPTQRCRSAFASGKKADAILGLTAPSTPGDYLLLLDVGDPGAWLARRLGCGPDARPDHGRRTRLTPGPGRQRAPVRQRPIRPVTTEAPSPADP